MSATTASAALREPDAAAQSPSRLAWRRLRRDRAALVSGGFLVLLLLAVLPGAPLLGKLVGHGPNDLFPYAVDVALRPVGPWSHVPDTSFVPEINPKTFKQPPPPAGTPKTLFVLGADGPLGRDEATAAALRRTRLADCRGRRDAARAADRHDARHARSLLRRLGRLGRLALHRPRDGVPRAAARDRAREHGLGEDRRRHARRRAQPGRAVADPADRPVHVVLPGADRAFADPLAARARVRRGGGDDRRE